MFYKTYSQDGTFQKLDSIHGWFYPLGNSPETYFKRDDQNGSYPILKLNLGNSENTTFDMGYSNGQWNSVFKIGSNGVVQLDGWLGIGVTSSNITKKGILLGLGQESIEIMTSAHLLGSSVKIHGYDPANQAGRVGLSFLTKDYEANDYSNTDAPALFITSGHSDKSKIGNVGIGTDNPQNKLSVRGTIWAKEVKVSMEDAADWVFDEDYDLKSLEDVESFVKINKHLPDVPSADQFRKNDMNLGEMNNILLQKMEEMTLYMIDINKEMKELKAKNAELEKKINN